MQYFNSPNAPAPGGHYSQAVIHNGLIYISGQLPVNPFTGEKVTGSVEDQIEQILDNLNTILKDAGTDKKNVIKCTVYISDISLWGRVNEVYSNFFGKYKPARAVVPVKDLHYGFKVELEAIAAI
jgi:2-iminobutanoate/2-iminopropanoate deaminase